MLKKEKKLEKFCFGLVHDRLEKLRGRVLTITEATADKDKLEAVKSLIHKEFNDVNWELQKDENRITGEKNFSVEQKD